MSDPMLSVAELRNLTEAARSKLLTEAYAEFERWFNCHARDRAARGDSRMTFYPKTPINYEVSERLIIVIQEKIPDLHVCQVGSLIDGGCIQVSW